MLCVNLKNNPLNSSRYKLQDGKPGSLLNLVGVSKTLFIGGKTNETNND